MFSKELLAATLHQCPKHKVIVGPMIHVYHRLSTKDKHIVELVQHITAVLGDVPDPDLIERLIGSEAFQAASEKCIAAQEDLAKGRLVFGLCLDDFVVPLDDL